MQNCHVRRPAHWGPFARMLALWLWFLGMSAWANSPLDLPLETLNSGGDASHRAPILPRPIRWGEGRGEGQLSTQSGRAQALQTRGRWSLTPLQFRFLYETKPNETYLLTRHFTVWTNGVVHSTLSVSNLVRGDGTTRWETNLLEVVVERIERTEQLDPHSSQTSETGGWKRTSTTEPEGVVFKLGSEVLARGLAKDMAIGISRVSLERYGLGCGSCSTAVSLAPGRPGPLFDGVVLRFGLGLTDFGQAVGELNFSTREPTSRMCQPDALHLLVLPECVTRITDPGSGRLRQVGSSQCLADIFPLDAYGYRICFYATNALLPGHDLHSLIPTNGLRPFVTWTIENPDGAASMHRLQVIESVGALHITNTYTWNPLPVRSGEWGVRNANSGAGTEIPNSEIELKKELPAPSGLFRTPNSGRMGRGSWNSTAPGWELLAGNGLRRQTLTSSRDTRRGLRTETLQTFNPADGRLVAQTLTKYQRFDWGDGLVEETTGAGSQARTTTYSYYATPGKPWHGKLQQVLRADGSWERYDYDSKGRLKARYSPYGNTAPEDWRNGRAITYDYSPWTGFGDQANLFGLRPRTTTETVRGTVVARSYFLAATNGRNGETVKRRNGETVPLTPALSPSDGARGRGDETVQTIQIQCSAPSREPFDGPALCTTNLYGVPTLNSQLSTLNLHSVAHPDGTLTLYTYYSGPAGLITVIGSGQPNSNHTDILDGTQTVTITGPVGQLLAKELYDIAPGRTNLLTHRESYHYLDELQRSYQMTYLDGTTEVFQYGCCGLESWTDRDGLVTLYAHDELKRLKTESRLVDGSQMLTTSYRYDAADHRLYSVRTGTDGASRITLNSAAYDTAGRLLYQTNALGGVTRLSYGRDGEGRSVTTNCYPDGGIRIELANRDGSLHQVHGSAVHGLRYDYGVTADGRLFTREIKLTQAGEPTEEWVVEYTDRLGRPWKTEYADGAFAQRFFNARGQLFKEQDPDGAITLYAYNARGERTLTAVQVRGSPSALSSQLSTQPPPSSLAPSDGERAGVRGSASTLQRFNASTLQLSNLIDFSGADRISQTVRDVLFNPALGTTVHRSRTYVWDTFQSDQSNLVASLETSVDGLKSWRTLWNEGQGTTNFRSISFGPGGLRSQSDYAPDGSCSYQRYRYGRLELEETRDAAGTALLQTTYEYDAHNRVRTQTDRRNGATTFAYNNAGQVTRVTTPPPEPRVPPQITLTHYNLMLQPISVVFPDNTSVHTEYHLTGEIRRRYGARTYPVEYAYDYAGRVSALTTWKDPTDQRSAAVTTFHYHPRRGWLETKCHADGQGPAYEYYPSGKLRQRTWARETAPGSGIRVTTIYTYNASGDLESIRYNDSLTPPLQYAYDRRGRLVRITQGTAQTLLGYNQAGQLVREAYPSGLLAGLSLTNGYDRYLRRTSVSLNSSSLAPSDGERAGVRGAASTLNSQLSTLNFPLRLTYSYDAISRLQSISNGSYSATYIYATNSSQLKSIQLKHKDQTRLSITRDYDALQRLLSSAALPAASALLSYDYVYNEANEPIKATVANCSFWRYTYDPLGQLQIARKYWSDNAPVAGQQFEYGHDQCGNRTLCVAGGDAQGQHLRPTTYTANLLNQHTSRTSAGGVDVFGTDTNAVTVNGQPVYQKEGYFWTEVATDAAAAPAWLTLTISANNQPPRAQPVFVPATPEQFRHDTDGNLIRDGRWTYTWDAENRLIRMAAHASVGPQQRLDFAYDWQGRRIQKTVSLRNPSTGAYEPSNQIKCVYDGWNLIAELAPLTPALSPSDGERGSASTLNPQLYTLNRSYTWGLDLSGSLQEAGGIGGLLMVTDYSTGQPATHFAADDGHGNLTALIQAADGTLSAQYEYGPFGEALVATGPMANHNPFRFSSRYQDEETGLLYCGYRYYSPSTGRWLSREPLNELAFWKAAATGLAAPVIAGSGSLFENSDYVYVKNRPPGHFDVLGLASSCDADVQQAFRSRRNQKLLEKMARAGCPPPNIRGADLEGYCAVPGCLGDYSCPSKEGKLCCANLNGNLQIERTAHHELIHALDCCTHGLETCEEHLCSEIVAYYMADCEGFVNRLECAIGQMKLSMAEDPKCEAVVAGVTKQTAQKCLKDWRAAQKRF